MFLVRWPSRDRTMFFEEFDTGQKYSTKGRTVTEADAVLFSTLTGAYNPLFLDEVHASKTPFKSRIVPGLLTVSLCTGLIYQLSVDPFGEGFVALVSARMKWLKAVRHGDTIRSEVVVIDKKPLENHRGFVTLKAKTMNQENQEVGEVEYNIIVQTRS
jgi:3-hydroxybutyryl-CoA dehydratase